MAPAPISTGVRTPAGTRPPSAVRGVANTTVAHSAHTAATDHEILSPMSANHMHSIVTACRCEGDENAGQTECRSSSIRSSTTWSGWTIGAATPTCSSAAPVKTAPGKPGPPHHRGGFSPDGAAPTTTGRTR